MKHLERHEESSGSGKLINEIGLSKFARENTGFLLTFG